MSSGSPVDNKYWTTKRTKFHGCINFLIFVVLSTLFDVDVSEINETL